MRNTVLELSPSQSRPHICIARPEHRARPAPLKSIALKYHEYTETSILARPAAAAAAPVLPSGGQCAKLAPQKAGRLDSMRHSNAKTLFAGVQNRLRKDTTRPGDTTADRARRRRRFLAGCVLRSGSDVPAGPSGPRETSELPGGPAKSKSEAAAWGGLEERMEYAVVAPNRADSRECLPNEPSVSV